MDLRLIVPVVRCSSGMSHDSCVTSVHWSFSTTSQAFCLWYAIGECREIIGSAPIQNTNWWCWKERERNVSRLQRHCIVLVWTMLPNVLCVYDGIALVFCTSSASDVHIVRAYDVRMRWFANLLHHHISLEESSCSFGPEWFLVVLLFFVLFVSV